MNNWHRVVGINFYGVLHGIKAFAAVCTLMECLYAQLRDLGAAVRAHVVLPPLTKARIKAPAARVLLVDYLTVLGEDSGPATPFSDEELGRLLLIQSAIGRVFKDAASRTGAELILASSLSAGHALGSPEPWVQPFRQVTGQNGVSLPQAMMRTGASFHPNEAGMAAIAAELERVLRS